MKTNLWNGERWLSLSAMFISLCTLGVFIYQTNLIRKEQFMSVYPYLTISNNMDEDGNYFLMLKNTGIGPAILQSVAIETKDPDNPAFTDVVDFVRYQVARKQDSLLYTFSNLWPGRMISAEEEVHIVHMLQNDFTRSRRMRNILMGDTIIKRVAIRYQSIYGETWELTHESGLVRPKKLD